MVWKLASAAQALLLATGLAASVTPAQASDQRWGGLYIGASIGAQTFNADWATKTALDPTGAAIPFSTAPTETFDDTSFRFGLYGGYNWQFAPHWVAGLEGEIGKANHKDRAERYPGLGVIGGGTFTTVEATDVDGSIRARLGYLLTPTLLLYGTVGVAFEKFEIKAVCPADTTVCNPAFGTQTRSWHASGTGVTVGGGLETMLGSNWLARIDYRFAYFGEADFSITPNPILIFGANSTVDLSTHTVSAGLAYKF